MFLILISLVLNLNIYADGSKCIVTVSKGNQINLFSTFTLEEINNNDNYDSFKVTTTKEGEGALIIDVYDDSGKISASVGIPNPTIAQIKEQYNFTCGNGNIIQKISQTGKGYFHPTRKENFYITVDQSTTCSEQDIAILLLLIDNWYYL